MDAKKLVILVLVVIAVVCAMALGTGVYQAKQDKTRSDTTSGLADVLGRLFLPNHTTLDSARLKPQPGCIASGKGPGAKIAVGPASCTVVIDRGRRSKPQALRIAPPPAAPGYACLALSDSAFRANCPPLVPKTDFKFSEPVSFSVGRDSAFLRLYCALVPNVSCVFTLR